MEGYWVMSKGRRLMRRGLRGVSEEWEDMNGRSRKKKGIVTQNLLRSFIKRS